MGFLIGLTLAAGAVLVLGAALAIILAKRVVLPRAAKTVRVHAVSADRVLLDADAKTTHPGEFGLWLDEVGAHLRVGAVRSNDSLEGRVEREVFAVSGSEPTAGAGRWTGHVFAGPEKVDASSREVVLKVEGGAAPAWLFQPVHGDGAVWAVHIHGIRTSRITALRSVPLSQEQGYTSIVPSFRGDGEGPDTARGASMLGQTEWRDVEAALAYAVDHGAQSMVLVGWSMGGQIDLQLSEHSVYRDRIVGLVLIAPATDWRSIIRAGAMRAKLPASVGRLAEWALEARLPSRIVGLPAPIDLDALDWGASQRVMKPCLVVHSSGDQEVPFLLTRRFGEVNRGMVEIAEFADAHHAWEYNLNANRFHRVIADWLGRTVARP
jgi:pimeloyl-ACP methyl ester carboxylesterase